MNFNLATLLTWKVKLFLAGALLLGSAWYIKHRETVAYEHGVASGRQSGWDDAQKQKAQEWADERARIAQERAQLEASANQLTAQRTSLDRTRSTLSSQLAAQLVELTARNLQEKQNAQNLPSSDLVPAILRTLDALDLLERERAIRAGGGQSTTN